MKIEITYEELAYLKIIRNYFGEHDKTVNEHMAFSIITDLIKKIQAEIPPLNEIQNIR